MNTDSTETPTPRTDFAQQSFRMTKDKRPVDASLARTLERELTAALAKQAEMRDKLGDLSDRIQSDTPLTDAHLEQTRTSPGENLFASARFTRQLERANAALRAQLAKKKRENKALHEATETMMVNVVREKELEDQLNAALAKNEEMRHRLQWAIQVFESHGDFSKLPWDRADEWLPYAKQSIEQPLPQPPEEKP